MRSLEEIKVDNCPISRQARRRKLQPYPARHDGDLLVRAGRPTLGFYTPIGWELVAVYVVPKQEEAAFFRTHVKAGRGYALESQTAETFRYREYKRLTSEEIKSREEAA